MERLRTDGCVAAAHKAAGISLYRTAFDRRNLSANRQLLLRNVTATLVRALNGTAAWRKHRSFTDGLANRQNR
jgi:hypothetical protein